jgi:hypothetical protein
MDDLVTLLSFGYEISEQLGNVVVAGGRRKSVVPASMEIDDDPRQDENEKGKW